MAIPLEISDQAKNDLAEYGAQSKVFAPWSTIHSDFKGVVDGMPMVLQWTKRGTALVPWHGPEALSALLSTDHLS